MTQTTITSAQYHTDSISGETCGIKATINNNEWLIPLDPANTEYAEIMRQVEAGELTIQEADSE